MYHNQSINYPLKSIINNAYVAYVIGLIAMISYRLMILIQVGVHSANEDRMVTLFEHQEHAYLLLENPVLSDLMSGLHIQLAAPLLIPVMILLPYALIALFLFKKQNALHAMLMLCVPLMITDNYGYMIPLGAFAGMSIACLSSLLLFNVRNYYNIFFIGFATSFAYFLHWNTALISIPVLAFLLFHNWKKISSYTCLGIGLYIGSGIHIFLGLFQSTY